MKSPVLDRRCGGFTADFAPLLMKVEKPVPVDKGRAGTTRTTLVLSNRALRTADELRELSLGEPSCPKVNDDFLHVHDTDYHVSDKSGQQFYITKVSGLMTYIVAMSTFGERLAWARKQKKFSQQELAEKAGVPLSSIGNSEAGTRHSIRKIASVAAVLDVDVKWLSEGEGTYDAHKKQLRLVESSTRSNWVRLAPPELSLVTTFRETTEKGRAMIEMAIQMAEKEIESVAMNQS